MADYYREKKIPKESTKKKKKKPEKVRSVRSQNTRSTPIVHTTDKHVENEKQYH